MKFKYIIFITIALVAYHCIYCLEPFTPSDFSAIQTSNQPSYIKLLPRELRTRIMQYQSMNDLISYIDTLRKSIDPDYDNEQIIKIVDSILQTSPYLPKDFAAIDQLMSYLQSPGVAIVPSHTAYAGLQFNSPAVLHWLKIKASQDPKIKLYLDSRLYFESNPNIQESKKLIAAGADVNSQMPNNKRTPLILGVWQKRPDYIKFLLENGANPHARDSAGKTALDYAIEKNARSEIIEMLKNAMSGPTQQAFEEMQAQPEQYYPPRLPTELRKELIKYMQGTEK